MPLLLTLTQGESDKHFMCIQSCIIIVFNSESEDDEVSLSTPTPSPPSTPQHTNRRGRRQARGRGRRGRGREDKEGDRQGRMEKKDRGEKIISKYNNIIEHEH